MEITFGGSAIAPNSNLIIQTGNADSVCAKFFRRSMPPPGKTLESPSELTLLSVVIPARNEAGHLSSTIQHLHDAFCRQKISHEIIVIDDGSTDGTWKLLRALQTTVHELHPIQNPAPHGFGRAVVRGLDEIQGDAVIVMMADESDDCGDAVRYWRTLSQGYDCVFGSRFIKGGTVIDYPWPKLILNRVANWFIRLLFRIPLNDTTNAFKAYRREVIDGCRPLLSHHFNLTVELPLKAIVRGYSSAIIPITWRNRKVGESKWSIKEMGSRYLFICFYLWLEKYLSRGDYRRSK
jgi:dolichol-phosphate mannosyltransferase